MNMKQIEAVIRSGILTADLAAERIEYLQSTGVYVVRLYSSGGWSGNPAHDWLMSDGSIETLTIDEANQLTRRH